MFSEHKFPTLGNIELLGLMVVFIFIFIRKYQDYYTNCLYHFTLPTKLRQRFQFLCILVAWSIIIIINGIKFYLFYYVCTDTLYSLNLDFTDG